MRHGALYGVREFSGICIRIDKLAPICTGGRNGARRTFALTFDALARSDAQAVAARRLVECKWSVPTGGST